MNIDEFLNNTRKIVAEGKALHDNADDILKYCENKGLIISYPDVFKRVYKIEEVLEL